MSPFRETALLPPQSRIAWIANPQISRGGADAALNGQLQTDARPSRDGSEQFGSGTQEHKVQPTLRSLLKSPYFYRKL